MRIPRWPLGAVLLAALAMGTTRLSAQGVTTGAVAGVISGENGQPVEAAQVRATNTTTGFVRGVSTKADGRYTVPGLEVGQYTVTVRRIGFEPLTQQATVTLGQVTRLDFQLRTQAAQLAGVTVTAETQDNLIAPSHSGAFTTITDSSLRRLPSINRNFTDLVVLTPQVSSTGPGLSGGGTNNRYNNIQIDGSTEADIFGLGSTGQPGGQANGKAIPLDAVKEYQVLLSPYDVRQGFFAGMGINAVTKSGTNEWHGSTYYEGRNNQMSRHGASAPWMTQFNKEQYGFSLGGPIVKDKLLFFVSPEWTASSTPASGLYIGSQGTSLTQASLDQVTQALSAYGVPTGGGGLVNNKNPLTNIFSRIDVSLPWNTQFVLHYNYGEAQQDIFSRSASGFQLTSNGYHFTSNKYGTVGQFRTLFGNGSFNELFINYTRINDRRTPNSRGPQVSVVSGGYTVIGGSERFSQGNELDQFITEITDNYSLPVGSHRFTIGTQNQLYRFRNLFTQASYGVWSFDSVGALNAGTASQYIIGVPLSGDGAVRFKAASYGGYIQDEWSATPKLNISYGLRVDDPVFLDKPPLNQEILTDYGRDNSKPPSGNLEWSPRIGFNYDATGDQRNQVRGGIGMFAGRPAFVWLSNIFQNSGSVGIGLLTCNASKKQVPTFNSANVSSPPQQCADGTQAKAGGEIDLAQKNLHMPQNLRGTLGYDRRLGDNWIATLEGMYTWGIYGLMYKNIALSGVATGVPLGIDVAHGGRWIYGNGSTSVGGSGSPTVQQPGNRQQIFDISNQAHDHAYQLTAGLQRRFMNNFEGSLFYTYSKAYDAMSFTSSTAFSQYRFGRAWAFDQNDTRATRSIFEQPHKIVASGMYSFPTKTDVSLYYIGASGTPYDYVVNGDPNGDGVTLNDPVYVPSDVYNPNQILLTNFTANGKTVTVAQQQAALNDFINSTPCLRNNRGRIIPRNSCDNPWTNTVNLSVRQSLKTIGMQNVSVEWQVYNFMNLLNSNWGHQPSAGFGSQNLLTMRGRQGADLVNGQPIYSFDPTYVKFLSNNVYSVYQMQLMAKYTF